MSTLEKLKAKIQETCCVCGEKAEYHCGSCKTDYNFWKLKNTFSEEWSRYSRFAKSENKQ